MKVGDRVYWNDPDERIASGAGEIRDIYGEVFLVKIDSGSLAETFEEELDLIGSRV